MPKPKVTNPLAVDLTALTRQVAAPSAVVEAEIPVTEKQKPGPKAGYKKVSEEERRIPLSVTVPRIKAESSKALAAASHRTMSDMVVDALDLLAVIADPTKKGKVREAAIARITALYAPTVQE